MHAICTQNACTLYNVRGGMSIVYNMWELAPVAFFSRELPVIFNLPVILNLRAVDHIQSAKGRLVAFNSN